jgi:hypothetical protein
MAYKPSALPILPSNDWPESPDEIDELVGDQWVPFAAEMNSFSEKAISKYKIRGMDTDICPLGCDLGDYTKTAFSKADPEMSAMGTHKVIRNDYFPKDPESDKFVIVFYTGIKRKFGIIVLSDSSTEPLFLDEFIIASEKGKARIVPLRIRGAKETGSMDYQKGDSKNEK